MPTKTHPIARPGLSLIAGFILFAVVVVLAMSAQVHRWSSSTQPLPTDDIASEALLGFGS
jgi:hypothetical protein